MCPALVKKNIFQNQFICSPRNKSDATISWKLHFYCLQINCMGILNYYYSSCFSWGFYMEGLLEVYYDCSRRD